jgi:hypothetical protein
VLKSISDITEVSTIEEGRLRLEERDIDAAIYIRLVEPWADEWLSGESDSTVARLGGGTGLVIAFGKKFD